MQKISPFLWFDSEAEEAARFYVSVFPDSRIERINFYLEGSPRPAGSVMSVLFRLSGQTFMALNGGPEFSFSPAISFFVDCATQEELDEYWVELSRGGSEGQCGWLTDRYGVSWQIVPSSLGSMLGSEDRERAGRVMAAMLGMGKLVIADLKKAYEES